MLMRLQTARLSVGLFLLGILLSGCAWREARAARREAARIERFTGGPTRITWVRDDGQKNDVFARGERLTLMALDTRDGRGERVLLAGPANFSKPLITPDGRRVVFSDHGAQTVHVMDWDGSGLRPLAEGMGLAVWRDPGDGEEWVYVGSEPADTHAPSYRQLHRHPIDRPEYRELVWSGAAVGEDNFQLSADGRVAGGNFPWPECGLLHLEEGRFERLGRGCWTSLAPDHSLLFWIFDGSHRNLTMFDTRQGHSWTINLSSAPGLDGHEAYHPRWSNHPRLFALTGPYTIRAGGNNIRGGGPEVDVHLGRFSEDYRTVEDWIQVTRNPYANFLPDVWVANAAEAEAVRPTAAAAAAPPEAPTEPERVTVRVRLAAASPVPSPEAIAPYTRGLVAHVYEVLEVLDGPLEAREILVAHWVIRESRTLDSAERREGERFTLVLEPYDSRPDLEGERLSMDSDRLLLPLFYDTGS